MAVVVLIGGMILAFSTPAINRYIIEARLRDSANRVAGEMRLARQKAVSKNNKIWFWTWADVNYYWIGEQTWQGNSTWTNPVWRGPYYLPSTVLVKNPNFGGLNYFWYTPDGRPSSAGNMMLISTSAFPDTVQINVDLSGSVWQ
jgi:type II secretory pathway pseudopilin PulG